VALGEGNREGPKAIPAEKRSRWARNQDDITKWSELFEGGLTVVHIAERFRVDPQTVSNELHRLGLTITQGHHMVEQLPLRYSPQFIELIDSGPEAVLEFVKNRVDVLGLPRIRMGRNDNLEPDSHELDSWHTQDIPDEVCSRRCRF